MKGSSEDGLDARRLGPNHLTLCFVRAKLLQSCLTLQFYELHSPPGCSVHGILQARILEWAAISSSQPGVKPASLMPPTSAGGFLTASAAREARTF